MLKLSTQHFQAIETHAAHSYPSECCGLLLGKSMLDPETSETLEINVADVVAVPNAWTPEVAATMAVALDDGGVEAERSHHSQADRYWIDPQNLLTWQRTARDRHLDIVGIYHSHPDHPAVPSECDRRLAWAGYAYLIISVCNGASVDLRCWTLDDNHQFQPEAIQAVPHLSKALTAPSHQPIQQDSLP